jgi:hypothetical protein
MWLFVEHIAGTACDQRGGFLRCKFMHRYEVRPRKDKRGVDLESFLIAGLQLHSGGG